MKALTLTQPWASLVALGHKTVETRSWNTHYRGPVAIHAAKGRSREDMEFAAVEYTDGRLPVPPAQLPLGSIIATARLVRVERTQNVAHSLTELELHLGNFDWGRYAWFLEDIEPLPEPIAARGALGLWEWARGDR